MKRKILKHALPLFLSLATITSIISLTNSQETQKRRSRLHVEPLIQQEIVERAIGKIDVMMRQGNKAYNQDPFWKEYGVVKTVAGRVCLTARLKPTPYSTLLHHISTTGDLADTNSASEGLLPGYELHALNPHTPITYNGEAVTCFLTTEEEQKRRERRDSELTEILFNMLN